MLIEHIEIKKKCFYELLFLMKIINFFLKTYKYEFLNSKI